MLARETEARQMSDVIRRPERAETNEYYFKYIDLVREGDIRQILADQHSKALSFLSAIPESRVLHRYAPDKWTVAEVVGHIIDTERVFMMRAFWFARAHTSPLPSYESDAVVGIARASERSWVTLVDEYDAVRASTVAFFRYLPDDAWARNGIASDYPFSVRSLAYIAAGHVIHHTRILEERYEVHVPS